MLMVAETCVLLNVGDSVYWSGTWGNDPECVVKVQGITDNKNGSKGGPSIKSIPWAKIDGRNIIVDLDNGHWAYGDQLRRI